MIEEVDESLRSLIRRDALNGAKVEVAFDAPTKEWAARRNAPTIDVYLYDVREDLQRRELAFERVRDDDGRVTERRPPARRFKLSYLLTAWTQRPEDEHRLLSALLGCFLRYEALPENVLTDALARAGYPVYVTIALPPPQDRNLSDVWSALGGELKPSLDLVVTAPFVPARATAAGPPVLEQPRITVARADEAEAGPRAKKGKARRPRGKAAAKEEAEATAKEEAAEAAARVPLSEETVRGGAEEQPGRVVRVREMPRR